METNSTRQINYSSFVKELISDEVFQNSKDEDKTKARKTKLKK
jgi:hypothetical protein